MTPAARPAPTAAGYADREITHPPNWHDLVVVDVVLNAATTGLFLVCAAADLARPDLFRPVAAWAYPLALALLLADLLCLVLDLGDPLRFHHMLRVFKPSSPMSLGTWCLTAYSVPLTGLSVLTVGGLLGLLPADAGWVGPLHVVLVVLAVPFAFGSSAYKGVLFSTTAQPGWRDARHLGAYHTTSALAIGAGLLWPVAELAGQDRAAGLLRPSLGLLILLGAVPAWRLAAELRPALRRAYPAGDLRWATDFVLACRFFLPVVLAFFSGIVPAVGSAVALVAGAFAARRVMTLLPHRIAGH